ncbi:MAG TPA: hypothetical protein VLT90_04340 [Terriglobales bacterium]|nr:hypothetical protein [Terriglobales bacterium]
MKSPKDVLPASVAGNDAPENPVQPRTETVQLPAELCQAARDLIKETKFATLEEFLAFVLRDLTARDSSPMEERERQLLEQRLRDLGYL